MEFLTVAITLLALINTTLGHTVFTTLFINNVDQGDGTCVRMPMNPSTSTYPLIDLSSNDMACNVNGTTGVARVCPATQSSKLTFTFREYADASQPGAIDPSHKGPCAVYMKAVKSAIEDPGYGDGWFKIWDDGYDATTSQWCTEKLIANNGLLSVNIPSDLAGGYYLVRPELLALHQADKVPPQPQFYLGCAQIFLQSTASSLPANTVSIPGYVKAGDPSVVFNIYTPDFPYPMPGPSVYESTAAKKIKARTTYEKQTEGLEPADCVLVNANWCGIELDSYSTADGCWNASTACFAQDKQCYSSAPPTGSKNCPIWEAKCDAIQAACGAGNFTGPPNRGKNLSPAINSAAYSIPAVIPESSVSAADPESATYTSVPMSTSTQDGLQQFSLPPGLVSFITDTYSPASQSMTSAEPTTTSQNVPVITVTITVPYSKPSASTGPDDSGLTLSQDGNCGEVTGQTCMGSIFGNCCSQYGYCGNTTAYCGEGCMSGYGSCANMKKREPMLWHFRHHH